MVITRRCIFVFLLIVIFIFSNRLFSCERIEEETAAASLALVFRCFERLIRGLAISSRSTITRVSACSQCGLTTDHEARNVAIFNSQRTLCSLFSLYLPHKCLLLLRSLTSLHAFPCPRSFHRCFQPASGILPNAKRDFIRRAASSRRRKKPTRLEVESGFSPLTSSYYFKVH